MSSFKNVNNDYTLTCNNGAGLFTVNAQTVFTGNVTYNVPAVSVAPFLTVAANNTGTISDGGLLMQTGPTTFAGLRFDTSANNWQISSSVQANGAPIASYVTLGTSAAGSDTQLQFNNNNSLGASAALTFDYSSNVLTLAGTETFINVGNSTPSMVSNSTVLYSNPVSSGGTGLYFVSPTTAGELISRQAAIVYSIVF
jgi:hypothetical protein